jgi:glycerol-3-phosphate dehydrogenase
MYDVIIIGGGVSGCSLLYSLSRYRVKALLLEKENDLSCGTSKANSGIIHAGYDAAPGTLMAKYNAPGNALMYEICENLDIPHRKTGSVVIGFDGEDRKTLEKLYGQGVKNGVKGMKILEYDELHELEPHLSEEAKFALYAESAGVVSPWEFAAAQAECAVEGGCEVFLDSLVKGIRKEGGAFTVTMDRQGAETEVAARFVVNAAGVYSDLVSRMAEPEYFRIIPKRGEYFLMDPSEAHLANTVIFQCPVAAGKGVLVAPTAHGNLIVGPDSEVSGVEDTSVTASGLDFVKRTALKSIPEINTGYSIRNFAGVRADSDTGDFIVGESKYTPGFFNIAAIKSPGLTSAPAIAEDMVRMLEQAGLALEKNPGFAAKRKITRFRHLSDEEKKKAVGENPLYGTIVCRCLTVTEGEIVDALRRPLPPRSLDGVKRRCNPGMGRCQGGFCGPRVMEIIHRELGVPRTEIPQDRRGMYIITGETKTAEARA